MPDTSTLQSERKALQKIGLDAAYTFKGLYKTSDWFTIRNGGLLIVPIILGLIALASKTIPDKYLTSFEVIGLLATFLALITQGAHSKAALYQKHANEFKDVFDEAAAAYLRGSPTKADELMKRVSKLRQKTIETPITLIGRWWAEWRIGREMDLAWLNETPAGKTE